jgi:hypothetical protein
VENIYAKMADININMEMANINTHMKRKDIPLVHTPIMYESIHVRSHALVSSSKDSISTSISRSAEGLVWFGGECTQGICRSLTFIDLVERDDGEGEAHPYNTPGPVK